MLSTIYSQVGRSDEALKERQIGLERAGRTETAESLGVCMPGLASLKQILSACMGSGLGEEDFSAMIKFHERNVGVEVAAKK